jgi:o-succinylbenzoate---CoA ligase
MRALPARYGPELVDALSAALAGSGPAVLPLPDGAAGDRLRAALRPDLPVEDGVALVVPTSGSTGDPKGVLLTAAALEASAAATERRLGGPGRWLLALPVTHVAGLQVVLRSLRAGGPPVADPNFVAGTAALGSGHRYTSLVPTQLHRLLASGPATLDALRSYTAVLLGGAAAPPGLVDAARGAGVAVVVTYGMSETCGGCVYDGLPLDGVTVDLADDGRIRLAGPVLASGYRLRPELTAQAFAGGRYVTDDVGELAGGRLVVLGRADEMLVTGAEKIAPAAIEAALAEHPAVAEAAVIGVADPEWGQRVVAVVVLRDGARLTLDQAREQVARRLPRHAAPRELRVVDRLPLLPSGKPDRRALQGAAVSPAPRSAPTGPAGSVPAGPVPAGSVAAAPGPAVSAPARSVPAGSMPRGSVPPGSVPRGSVAAEAVRPGECGRR